MSQRPGFLAELKRRKVVRAVTVYLAGAFAALQAADVLFPVLGLPDWTMGLVVGLVAVGLPVVAGMAWAFDLTEGGLVADQVADDGGDRSAPRWYSLRTLILVGIMLMVGVGAGWMARSAASGRTLPAGERSIAVIPFDNLSSQEENAYFAVGVQDEILTQLGKISDLRVISRSSVMRYQPGPDRAAIPDIGDELGASWIVEGSVARVGQSVRINVQLIESASDDHAWAEAYDGDLTVQDMLAFQAQVARRIAESLRATIQPDEAVRIASLPTGDSRAYDLYLRGNELFAYRREAELRGALERYGEAIAIDSTYALAYAGQALVYAVLPFYSDASVWDSYARGVAAARRALALDSTVAEAHAALGDMRFHQDYDAQGAEASLRRAIELKPSYAQAYDWLAEPQWARDRPGEALASIQRALQLDPLSVRVNQSYGRILFLNRQTEAAIAQLRKTADMDPGLGGTQEALAQALMWAGRYDEAAVTYRRYAEAVGDEATVLERMALAVSSGSDVAKTEVARELDAVPQASWRLSPTTIAEAYLWLGRRDSALDWLERAYETRFVALPFINGTPTFDPLRDDPRFQALIGKMNLDGS